MPQDVSRETGCRYIFGELGKDFATYAQARRCGEPRCRNTAGRLTDYCGLHFDKTRAGFVPGPNESRQAQGLM